MKAYLLTKGVMFVDFCIFNPDTGQNQEQRQVYCLRFQLIIGP